MATARLLRASNNPNFNFHGSDGFRCLAAKKGGFNNGDEYPKKRVKNGDETKKLQMGGAGATTTHHHQVKLSMAAAASGSLVLITSEQKQRMIDGGVLDLVSSVASNVNNALFLFFREGSKRRSLKQKIQMFIERVLRFYFILYNFF